MDLYVCTNSFHLPVEGVDITVGTTVAKFVTKIDTLINGTEYLNAALYQWISSPNSLLYLSYSGTTPDPIGSVVKAGSFAITSGNNFVVVTGAAFGFVPTTIVVSVLKPNGSADNIFATPREGTFTTDGFTSDLSAPVNVSGYVLAYVASA